ncbi:hypothetical protein F3Y22_tig00110839pilonHSYRG00046 [Hibiscus syriacus]|uniref:RNase H type-1 domain-containing protein n=1 Tax=Hibiscus syriacus TaxID=106335 RepID=A0A6A2ZM79_HIBSY|nr:hypothetical protein F3Y22_tig00110839pilonHSYRG00046 [Hibiscus syriacus]
MWRLLISCKSTGGKDGLLPLLLNRKHFSWIWNAILKSFHCEDSFGTCLRLNLSLPVGNGKHISFWDDMWLDDSTLKSCFPRFYALALNREGLIVDFGTKCSAGWNWNISLRRGLFDRIIHSNAYDLAVFLESWGAFGASSTSQLNVDGAISSCGSKCGISGDLRDSEGFILLQFSELSIVCPVILVELYAVKIGLELFLNSVWFGKVRLLIKSDCKIVVDWFNQPPPLQIALIWYEVYWKQLRSMG